MSVQIWILGEAGLVDPAGAPIRLVSRRAWALMTYLIQARGRPVSRADLSDLLWPERGEEQARASLRQELAVTRKALREAGLDPIEAGKDSVRFVEPQMVADCAALEHLVAAGGLQDLRAAAALYRGPLLDGLSVRSDAFMGWLKSERARIATLAASGIERLLRVEEAEGDVQAMTVAAEAWLGIDPAAEPAHRALMQVLAEAGQYEEALRQFDTCTAASRLARQSEPSPETIDLAGEIRVLQATPSTPPDSPGQETDPMSERGIGTVLVAQLPQLATLDPGFEPAAVARAQDRFIDFARRVADDAGGWLLPGPGDRAVIVFPEESEAAAGLAALMLAGEPVPLDQSPPISPACGLSRSTLIVSEGGGLAGVALQVAARAAAMARPGEVLASAAMSPELVEDLTVADGPDAEFVALLADRPAPSPTLNPEVPSDLVTIWQGWGRAMMRADMRAAISLGEEARAFPGEGAAIGKVMIGAGKLLQGRLRPAMEALASAEDLYSSSEPHGLDPGLTARALMCWLQCLSGAPGLGGESLRRVLSEAQGLRHPPSTLMCLLIAAVVQDELGEPRAAFRSANSAYQAADGKPQWQALALACVGRCRDRIGEAQGAEHLDEALKRYRSAGGLTAVPLILGWLAASRLETGAASKGLALVDEALGEGSATGVMLLEPELLRLQAMLLTRQGRADRDQIEAAFVTGIETARRTGAGLYELRASVSFAAYLRGLGRLRDAISRLDRGIAAIAPGGQVTADMKSAQALRHRLALG